MTMFYCCCCRRRGKYTTTAVRPNYAQDTPESNRSYQIETKIPARKPDLRNSDSNNLTDLQSQQATSVPITRPISATDARTVINDTSLQSSAQKSTNDRKDSITTPQSNAKRNSSNVEPEDIPNTNSRNALNATEVRVDTNEDSGEMANRTKISFGIDLSDIEKEVRLSVTRPHLQNGLAQQEIKSTKHKSSSDSSDNSDAEDAVKPGKSDNNAPTVKFESEVEYITDDSNAGDNSDKRRGGIREVVNVDATEEIPNHQKSSEDTLHLKNAFAANDFLANVLTGESLDKVISAMHERKVTAGEIIIEEGEPGNNMYVSQRGTYEVYVKKKLYSTFSDKRVFGELAILYNSKRMATVKAVTDGKVWMLQRHVYQQIVVQSAIKDFEQTLSFLRNVPLVNKLPDESLSKIANLLRREFFKTDAVIVREGEPGDKFYIIRAGCVTITKEKQGKVSELGQGAFFGERALLTDDARQATVLANAPGVECLTLTRPEFKRHFNDITLLPEGQVRISNGKSPVVKPIFTPPPNEYSDVTLGDLEKKATLGVGGFGRVELVQHRKNPKQTFALKYLKKIDMLQQDQVEHVFNERDIQINCNSIFIVRMYNTFKDNKYLYFLMESCLGGDLWTYLQKRKGRMVSELDARFYAGCVLEAFSYLHERNIIYRDLKPENLLIDARGYVKLTDFGFAKSLNTATKTYTFAGTPEYVAPEIIYNRGHDKSVDYWAFGVLIFELLVGRTPFRTDDHTNMMTYNRILRGINSVAFPPFVTKSATHLIQKLCRPVPTDRLGNQKNGIQDIRGHKWFQGFDWDKLRNQNMKAPFVPKLSTNIDTRYFEQFGADQDIPPDETSSFANF